jgi:hypothetical protein
MGNAKSLLIFGLIAILAVSFNNCSKVGFTPSKDDEKVQGLSSDLDPEVIDEVIHNCNTRGLQIYSQNIVFEDTRVETGRSVICQFNQGDNLDQLDHYMRARYTQNQKLNLPDGAVVCDIQMSTSLQKFKYDDVFFLTYNGLVLATNNKTTFEQRLSPESNAKVAGKTVPLIRYDWLKLRNGSFDNVQDDYCLGAQQNLASCQWPITEQQGSIKFSFHPELLINLGLHSSGNEHDFGFVITGDDDADVDCYHDRLEFQMTAKYYIP